MSICRQFRFVILLAFIYFVSPTDLFLVQGAQPQLKKGVRLQIGRSRLQGWAAPEVVDWNDDGQNDLLVGHYSGALSVYLNRGYSIAGIVFEKVDVIRQDGFGSGEASNWAWRFNKPTCVCPGPGRICPRVVDWDNDGKKDLVIGDGRGAQTRVWRNIGTSSAPAFSTHHLQYFPPDAGIRPYHETVQPCIADWNGDGRKDLIMGRNRGIYVYLNQGRDDAPQFDFDRSRLGEKIRDVFPTERLSPAFVDWDADGKSDLVVGSQQGEVWFARNTGSKTQPKFAGYVRVQAGGTPINVGSEARIATADLDGDGQKDLLVGADNGVVWFFQARQPKPIARKRFVRVKRDRPVPIRLVGTDDAQRALKYTVLSLPTHGTLTGASPNFSYTPKKGFVGKDQLHFIVSAGELRSEPTTVTIEVQPPDKPPQITTRPHDDLVAVGQPANFRVVATGVPPFSYQWKRDGEVIPRATGPGYFIRETSDEDDGAKFSVTVTNAVGSVSSREAVLQVGSLPTKADDVPVVDIQFKSPVIEPSTPGVLTLTRTGNKSKPVTVKLTSRPGHSPVIADIHYVPVPTSITFEAGETAKDVRVVPIDDTLVDGKKSLTFRITPNPAYRLATKLGAANMIFHDDDCPHVGIGLANGKTHTFEVTAEPAPRRDTEIVYSVSGTAIAGVDYERMSGTVTIPAGKTRATITVKPYRQVATSESKPAPAKTVVVTLPSQPFTYFDFYGYLTTGRPRTASLSIASAETGPLAPAPLPADPSVERLRREVAAIGWIIFAARSGNANSDLDLFAMRPDGSQLRNMTNTPKFDEFSARVSPDGKKILYRRTTKQVRSPVSLRLPQDVGNVAVRTWPSSGTLVIAGADGSDPKSFGDEGEYAWATWGPDGKQIACLEKVTTKEPASDKPAAPKKESYRIVIRKSDTMEVVHDLRSRGIHGHAVWSPDGKRIVGTANIPPGTARSGKGIEYPLGLGKMVSVELATGRRTAMARFADWYPVWTTDTDGDWFRGGTPQILHSANNYGICPAYYAMLWRSGLDGKPSELVFAEAKKNIWGGCTSPDDRYAVFVIGGQSWPLLGKMAVVRLDDAPIARGRSTLFFEVLADQFPQLKKGPVLDLIDVPEGFDPQWTRSEIFGGVRSKN